MDEVDLDLVGASSASLRSRKARSTFTVSVTSWNVNSVAPSDSGVVVHSSTLPSLRSSLSATASTVVDAGDRAPQRLPARGIIIERLAPLLHGLDVRLMLHRIERQPPHPRERGIEQARAAVGAEYRDRLGEVVERLALDADHRGVAPFEVETFGGVVEDIGDAALLVRGHDDAQRAAVGQVPFLALRFDRAIGFQQTRLPGAEIVLLGQLACDAQAVEHVRVVGVCIEERDVEVPQPAIRTRCRKRAAAAHRTPQRRKTAGRACGDGRRPCARARPAMR